MLTSRGLNYVRVGKKVNHVLAKQVASLERQCWRNAQYSRRECIEVIGIPNSIVHRGLEKTVCKVLQHIRTGICEGKIGSCHRLNKQLDESKIF